MGQGHGEAEKARRKERNEDRAWTEQQHSQTNVAALLGRPGTHARRLVLARRADAVGVGGDLGRGPRALAAATAAMSPARRIAARGALAVGRQALARDVAHAAEERPRRVALEDEMAHAESAAAAALLGDGREKREQER